MQFAGESSVMSVQNFDFIAFSFARMQLRGRDVNLDNITGNMNATSKKWFQNRYNFYLSEFKDQSVKA
ncbi:glycogen synthase [Atlantibacter hermannii]|uniref:glycogen synthase n=1 Tax=Atlantibacter hermannii TaxID=565 RepID=UPI0005C1F6C4|nr:glycogen synthase [Atlantibacter hermannii]HAI50972.1 glycogen synthesis protein GlgS [Enterobacteriaceae bacterium]KIU34882.1 glycogen synthesis protein GlgS [Atlantibacter hermannii]MBW9431520.1 glycogen synthesis protein GlgS [Atlantibacter hermannii]HAP80592.1 glycogen synthesis protein GlgS [Enterobacteriaceae bacterium]HCC09931.1 glycogen synthesis protein GlgS [Atlantibacter hermannii]